jgi:hypothetical protein
VRRVTGELLAGDDGKAVRPATDMHSAIGACRAWLTHKMAEGDERRKVSLRGGDAYDWRHGGLVIGACDASSMQLRQWKISHKVHGKVCKLNLQRVEGGENEGVLRRPTVASELSTCTRTTGHALVNSLNFGVRIRLQAEAIIRYRRTLRASAVHTCMQAFHMTTARARHAIARVHINKLIVHRGRALARDLESL